MKNARAKLFQNGGSQAVRLPKVCRFPAQREVLVRREGRRVIFEPAATLARRGEPLGTFDTLMAAHALSRGLTFVTNNSKHFQRVRGLKIENWV